MSNQIRKYDGGGGFDATKLIIGLAVAYLLNPVDIPGPFDDAGALFFAMFVIGILGLFKGGAQ